MANSQTGATDQEVICQSLRLALIACQLRRTWHAGVIDADEAMRGLDRAIGEICLPRSMEWAPGRFDTVPGGRTKTRRSLLSPGHKTTKEEQTQ